MEKLEDYIKSFRVCKSTKQALVKMASLEEIQLQQLCRKILNKAAREFEQWESIVAEPGQLKAPFRI